MPKSKSGGSDPSDINKMVDGVKVEYEASFKSGTNQSASESRSSDRDYIRVFDPATGTIVNRKIEEISEKLELESDDHVIAFYSMKEPQV